MSKPDPNAALLREALYNLFPLLNGSSGLTFNLEEAEKKIAANRKREPADLGAFTQRHPDEICTRLDTAIDILNRLRATYSPVSQKDTNS